MIIAHLIGGLGNQMFQYAAARALSLRRGQEFRLDISDFKNYSLYHGFELKRVFTGPIPIASARDVRRILGWRLPPLAQRVIGRLGMEPRRRAGFVREPYFHYWASIDHVPPDCYLQGYWQSEKYFRDAAHVIRGDFTFRSPLQGRNAEVAARIAGAKAVSLHVRRGDYVANAKTNATHGVCSPEYYRAAIRAIADCMQQPHFFVFSDDIAWVKENLKPDFPCDYIDHNRGAESYNDMHLMSLCKAHIIANSSFSWWGAWLNARPDKVVIAPQKWFANNNDVKDLFPPDWITL